MYGVYVVFWTKEELNDALDKVRSVSDLTATEKGITSILDIIENEGDLSLVDYSQAVQIL